MRVVIAGGGTGGHLFPGLAVAEEFKRRDEGSEVIFIGTERGIESWVIPKEGYPMMFLDVEGFMGRGAVKKAVALVKTALAVLASVKIFRKVMPDIVIGTGGYLSLGPVMAARLLKIPNMILEQNLVPGVANKVLGKITGAVAVTYHESLPYFPRGKTYLTGNPIRPSIMNGDRLRAFELLSLEPGRFTVFVFGGSQGARNINNTVISALNSLLDVKEQVQFLHQTGDKDYENVRDAYRGLGMKASVVPFIYEMAEAYASADMVISRAGATTLAEITALGKPAVIIPYPHAAQGHQEFNAKKVAGMGAARMVRESEMSGELMAGLIREFLEDEDLRARMRRSGRAMGKPEAAKKVTDIAMSLIRTAIKIKGLHRDSNGHGPTQGHRPTQGHGPTQGHSPNQDHSPNNDRGSGKDSGQGGGRV